MHTKETNNKFIDMAECSNSSGLTLDAYINQIAIQMNLSEDEVFKVRLENGKLKWMEEFMRDSEFLGCIKSKFMALQYDYKGNFEQDNAELKEIYPNFARVLPAIMALTFG